MPVYLYCAIPAAGEAAPAPPPALRGVDGAPVRLLPAGPIAAWVSDVDEPVLAPTVARARAHDAVVRAALAAVTPVPARFGQIAADDGSLVSRLAGRREALVHALEHVHDCVEVDVRILLPAGAPAEQPAEPPRGSGTAYLRWLRERQQARQSNVDQAEFLRGRVAAVLAEEPVEVVRDAVWAPMGSDAQSVEVAHLVSRSMLARHRAIVRTVLEREGAMRVMLSGPWAPYTFCTTLHA